MSTEDLSNELPIGYIAVSVIFLGAAISNLILCFDYVEYQEDKMPQTIGCMDVTDRSGWTQQKIDQKKAEAEDERANIVRGDPKYKDDVYTSNVVISSILLVLAIILIIASVSKLYKKDFLSTLTNQSSKKIAFVMLGIIGVSGAIASGKLLDDYHNMRNITERKIATCVQLSEISTPSQAATALERRQALPTPERTKIENAAIAFAVLLGVISLILLINAATEGEDSDKFIQIPNPYQQQQQQPLPPVGTGPGTGHITINVNTDGFVKAQEPAAPAAAPAPPAAAPASSKIFTPAY